ncbi:NAD-dependent malic enzyme 59 kDa isoform, mitochondrial [Dichanthelium oligosanthes]|uniref:NAD-dependent malic enzyme 59 kDa isoform, mitochondrial n=1 Tax=Dichanthelium oligosanthes TaxID=888268 RepID=A0A1E5UQI2_9POAL|nr:NAD-dependent malic enzyme 59 kDa isoform, mitochondrial [Dichanthelium oligosanthes]
MWRSAARRSPQIRRLLSSSAPPAGAGAAVPGPCIVHKRGNDILHDPWYNKDTAFPMTERDRLGLRGLLPPRVMSFEQQYERFINSYKSLENNTRGEPDSIVALAKWRILNRLHDRNETLYYRVLIDNIEDFAPIIYTPTVGLVCENYSGLFRRPRGMYFSAKDKGEMMSMIYNWPAEKVDMIVVTDGSRILGLGDLGVQGIGIPIGKLDVYVAAAGINPQKGLITKARKGLDPAVARFARGYGPDEVPDLHEGASLVEVVKKVKPHVLLGLSGVGGIFNEEVLKAMKESDSSRPAVFAMSNPTTKAECTPDDVFKHVGENAIFASGSPFSNVSLGNGKTGYANQANNMYLFPGIGLGALLSGARHVSDGMLQSAAECLASYITDDEIRKGILFPSVSSIRHITARVGASVVRAAVAEDLAEGCCDVGPRELGSMSESETVDYVARKMWYPIYSPLVSDK